MRLAVSVAAVLPAESLHDALSWSRGVCAGSEVSSVHLSKAVLSFYLSLEQRTQEQPEGPLLVATLIRSKLGDNMAEPDPSDELDELFAIVSEGNANALTSPVLDSLSAQMDDVERAVALWRKADPRKADGAEPLLALEQAVQDRYLLHVALLRTLCKSQLENTPAQQLLRTCMRLFRYTRMKLLATGYWLLATQHLLLATCYSTLATCYLLLATCYLLLNTCYLLLATQHLLLATCYLLLTSHY